MKQRSRGAFRAGLVGVILGAGTMFLGALIVIGSLMDMDPPYDKPVFWPFLVGCAVTALGVYAMWFGDGHPPERVAPT